MLNITRSANEQRAARTFASPGEFAEFVQREATLSWCARLNSLSKHTGFGAVPGSKGQIQIRIEDINRIRQCHESIGLTSETSDLVIAAYNSDQGQYWRSFQEVIDLSKQLCLSVLGDNRNACEEIPVAPIAESFLNAGAHPGPAEGMSIITVNAGLSLAHLWVIALQAIIGAEPKFTNEQRNLLLAQLPELSLMLMSGANAAYEYPNLANTFIQLQSTFGGPRTLTFSEAFPLLFVMLHEFGHIVLKHVDAIRNWASINEIVSKRRLDLLARLRDFEFDADGFAVDHIAQLMPNRDLTYVGMAFFFGLLYLHERQTAALPQELRTHPLAVDRFERAINRVFVVGDLPDLIKKMRGFMALIGRIDTRR